MVHIELCETNFVRSIHVAVKPRKQEVGFSVVSGLYRPRRGIDSPNETSSRIDGILVRKYKTGGGEEKRKTEF